MIIWGRFENGILNSGAKYNPLTNTRASIDTANAPTPRFRHTAVWSGSKMIVWGGNLIAGEANTGKIYDPVTDS